jgi:cobalt/nickel transport system permease protein
MHIPNAVLDPTVAVVTGVVGAAGLGYALRSVERTQGERTTVLMGTMAAFVFAAQMVNFPVGPGVSGHLLGGVLAAVLLGPWAGAVVIAAVLIVQCLVFGDGGLVALGANFVNMGLLGSVVGYAIYAPIRRAIGGRAGLIFGAMIAAWLTVILAAGAFAVELAASGHRAEFVRVLSWMLLVHAAIGVGEAVVTGLVLRFIVRTRPDLLDFPAARDETDRSRTADRLQLGAAGLALAVTVALFLAPFASEHPDGLEYVVGTRFDLLPKEATPTLPVPIKDYELKLFGAGALGAATAAAGCVGTLIVFGVAVGLSRIGRPAAATAPEGVPANAA